MMRSRPRQCGAAALVISLILVTLMTILIITLASVVSRENAMARLSHDGQRAELLARAALDAARSRIVTALAPFDDPFGSNAPATRFWAVAPGRVLLYSLGSTQARPQPVETVDLHTGAPFGLGPDEVIDLNAPAANGVRPINPSLPANQKMAVAWVPVLEDPSLPAAKDNPIIGRYAFWVDDECAKINVNTADGTRKGDPRWSYGPGAPAEVSLPGLGEGASGALSPAAAAGIVTRARDGGYAQAGEIAQVPGVPAHFYRENHFNLTGYSRSPEFNLFNEPRIQLASTNLVTLAGAALADNGLLFDPLFGDKTLRPGNLQSLAPVRSVYPTPAQITNGLSDDWLILPNLHSSGGIHPIRYGRLIKSSRVGTADAKNWSGYGAGYVSVAERIGGYLTGTDARGNAIRWPFEEGSYEGKYNLRQLDSITLQLLDTVKMSALGSPPQKKTGADFSLPTLAPFGILQDEAVFGVGRAPRINEVYASFTFTSLLNSDGDPIRGLLRGQIMVELYFPASSFQADPAYDGGYNNPGVIARFGNWDFDSQDDPTPHTASLLNVMDAPSVMDIGIPVPVGSVKGEHLVPLAGAGNGSAFGDSFWMDRMIIARDQAGNPAGIDFWGNASGLPDPDQTKAKAMRSPDADGTYKGRGPQANKGTPMLFMGHLGVPDTPGTYQFNNPVRPGTYAVTRNEFFGRDYSTHDAVNGLPPVTSVTLTGGLALWIRHQSITSEGMIDFAPIESLTGPARARYQNAERPHFRSADSQPDPDAVLPFPAAGVTASPGSPARVHLRVRDPFVNKNIGDWIVAADNTELTMPVTYVSGTHFTALHQVPNKGADDLAACWTSRTPYYSATAPKWPDWNTRFSLPSVGVLQTIRTKVMPDTGSNAGVPFRCLSFAPAEDETQEKIPDWALLDLFTVPNGVYRNAASAHGLNPPDYAFKTFFGGDYTELTYGGATSGRINPNGAVLYPWADAPDKEDRLPARAAPLAAMFQGLRYNRDGKLTVDKDGIITSLEGPLDAGAARALAGAVADEIEAAGPLFMPGQICDIPALAAYAATVNPTRNDVIAQTLGNLTTQSNVFSIWVASQAVRKARSNTQPGVFEAGDQVLSERRMRFVVERFLDLGADGVPGNLANPGPDGVVGTFDDPVDAQNHPRNPKFKYRVIHVQEIR